jgi:hypothetical protein
VIAVKLVQPPHHFEDFSFGVFWPVKNLTLSRHDAHV